ncbi:MAG: outer membrane protein assembly factor BamE [Chlorobi bacterium]|nr:outer membrane protein assembly factor BamE [Chlorobiota bacterium]
MNRIAIGVVALIVCNVAAGCLPTSKFNMENARKVKSGMTEEEVIALIGEPTSVSVNPMYTILMWSYVNRITRQYQTVTLYSKDGKIVSLQELTNQYNQDLIKNTLPGGVYGFPQPSDTDPDSTKKQQ